MNTAPPTPLASPTILGATASATRYCAIALHPVGKAAPVWLHAQGKIVVFESVAQAQDVLELLANGRDTQWHNKGEECVYFPLQSLPGQVNRAAIITGYDLYHLPAGHAVPSETRGRAWRHHVLQGHWLRGILDAS